MRTKITLSFNNGQFSLDTETGINLWSGKYDNLTQAIEFARSYCSNINSTVLHHEENLEEKFYSVKQKREKAFRNGVNLDSEE